MKAKNRAITVTAPRSGRDYRVASTVNILAPVAGEYVTKAQLEHLIAVGVRVTVTAAK